MSRVVAFLRQASAEFEEAIAWYEHQHAGLGMRFAGEVIAVAQHAAELPEIHVVIHKDLRFARVKRFPYSVIFREEPSRIIVIAVFHTRRDPGIWQRRT
jgi:plasmid stabilization system protein ParE